MGRAFLRRPVAIPLPMTAEQIALVRTTWSRLPITPDAFAERCYEELFLVRPQLRQLFVGFESEQHRKLASTIDFAVKEIPPTDAFRNTLANLGRRHDGYGVKSIHYEVVGAALMMALARTYGTEFHSGAREAWDAFYRLLVDAMCPPAH
jgi:hemoglobin-like flavoprotein